MKKQPFPQARSLATVSAGFGPLCFIADTRYRDGTGKSAYLFGPDVKWNGCGVFDACSTAWFRWMGGQPAFRIYGKARGEALWRIIDVFASDRRNMASGLPLWGGACTTWSSGVIAVGWEFADLVISEQATEPSSREHYIEVAGGRLRDPARRRSAGATSYPTASEILAHECGHTWQARRLGAAYLPLVGAVTLCREGRHFWNHFENQASEIGLFGGLVNGSVCSRLMH